MLHSRTSLCGKQSLLPAQGQPTAVHAPLPTASPKFHGNRHLDACCTRFPATAEELRLSPLAQQNSRSKRALRLPAPQREINWSRWELAMMLKAEEKEAKAAQEASSQAKPDDDFDLEAESSSTSTSSGSGSTQAYFRQYDNPNSHLPLLQDSVLTRTWQLALDQLAPEHIRGKVVLDVGCGPGHLAMLCAQAGAEHVIAVDGSAAIAEVARQAVDANGLSDKVTVLHADVESSSFQLVKKADLLVSNFAGPGLLAGGMLRAVARARRDLLKAGGLVLPSRAELFVSGIEDREALAAAKAAWDVPVAGLSFAPAMMQVVRHPRVETLQRASQMATSTSSVLQLDTASLGVRTAALGFSSLPFSLTATRDERLFGLVLHFDLGFGRPCSQQSRPDEQAATSTLSGGNQGEVAVFTSDPRAPPTHYQQLVLSFPRAVRVVKGDVLEGTMSLQPSGTQGCDLEIRVELTFQGTTATTSYLLVHGAYRQTPL